MPRAPSLSAFTTTDGGGLARSDIHRQDGAAGRMPISPDCPRARPQTPPRLLPESGVRLLYGALWAPEEPRPLAKLSYPPQAGQAGVTALWKNVFPPISAHLALGDGLNFRLFSVLPLPRRLLSLAGDPVRGRPRSWGGPAANPACGCMGSCLTESGVGTR